MKNAVNCGDHSKTQVKRRWN